MADAWKDLRGMINYSDGGVLSKIIEKSNAANIALFCMAENTEISSHTSTKAGYVYVLEGNGTFILENEEIPMKPGTFINLSPNAVHSLIVKSNTSFVLFLINNTVEFT